MPGKIEHTVLDIVESAFRNVRAVPINLNGVSGPDGGAGGPPGGFIGQLPQYKVTYDYTEAAYSGLAASGISLMDNLAHIRYRLNILESGGSITVVDDNNALYYYDTDTIHFSGAGVVVTDLGNGDVKVSITASGVVGSGGGFTEAQLDTMYLRLDTSNDPLTGELRSDIPYPLGYDDYIYLTRIQGNTRHILQGNGATTQFRYGDGNDPGKIFPPPAIYIEDLDIGTIYSGGTLMHADYATGTFRVNINPYAPPAGTLVLFDSVSAITQSGRLLSIKNQQDEKFYVTGSGVWGTENNIVATVPTPSTGYTNVYVDSVTKKLASKDDAGNITNYGAAVFDVSFEAYQADGSEQSLTNGAATVLICNTETKDTDGYYNTANGRFIPLKAGTYEFHATATIDSLGDGKEWWIGFRKNGGNVFWETAQIIGAAGSPTINGTTRYYLDGVDDYVEVIVYHNHGSDRNTFVSAGNPQGYGCRFSGHRISVSDICGT